MKASKACADQTKQQLSELGDIHYRTQFGGYALTVEQVVFAFINEGKLYLRASDQLAHYAHQHNLAPMIFYKRGLPVNLNYYQVDEHLRKNRALFTALSRSALECAIAQKKSRDTRNRIKDLPNLTVRIETMLRQIGITTTHRLCELGSRECWLRLRANNKHLGLQTLFALEGAISGRHQAALSVKVRSELAQWYVATLATKPS